MYNETMIEKYRIEDPYGIEERAVTQPTQQPTTEQLAEKVVTILDDEYFKGSGQFNRVAIIAKAIQTATEAKDREIERLHSELQRYQCAPEYDCGYANASESAKETITQLESKYALLVEKIDWMRPWVDNACDMIRRGEIVRKNEDGTIMPFKDEGWFFNPSKWISDALTNTTQQAQERDARLREAVIDEIATIPTQVAMGHYNTEDAWDRGYKSACDEISERVAQLKQKGGF